MVDFGVSALAENSAWNLSSPPCGMVEITPNDNVDLAKPIRGLMVTTAGSLAAGTGVGRMRLFMWVVQNECRYQDASS